MPPETAPVVVFGGTGYVAGELLRRLAGHPRFKVVAEVCFLAALEAGAETFPPLRGTSAERRQ